MKELKRVKLNDVMFIDIETSTSQPELELDSPLYDAWKYSKGKNGETDEELLQMYKDQGALYADFGRIVCISVGMIAGTKEFKTKTYNNLNEKHLIQGFYNMLDEFKGTYLCGHSIKQFDIPYIAKRGIINGIVPHKLVDTTGEKPWTMGWLLDTKELWQMGSFDRTSLIALTAVLGITSPKQDLQGKDVPKYFWENPEGHIQRISEYCERDVVAVYEVLKHFKELGLPEQQPVIKDSNGNPLRDSDGKVIRGFIDKEPIIKHLFNGGRYLKKHKEQLLAFMEGLTKEDQDTALDVLNSVVSRARGKKTKFTKKHVKELKEKL